MFQTPTTVYERLSNEIKNLADHRENSTPIGTFEIIPILECVPVKKSSTRRKHNNMEQRAQKELIALFQDAVKVGGAALEMRIRRFASLIRSTDEELAAAISPLVSGTRAQRGGAAPATPAPVDADTRLPLVRVDAVGTQRPTPLLDERTQRLIDQIIEERRSADKLAAAGLMAVRSVLMSGPPGVGKTLTASWLAGQLNLPLYTLDLASVMSSFLGRTGANVRAVLNHAQQEPCVLLLDEFDAIAKRRDDDADVGELKRLVTVILQTIDDWTPMSLLVAATNHGELLDPAVWRRFDLTIQFPLPSHAERMAALRQRAVPAALATVVARLTDGQNMSALMRAVESSRKQEILGGRPLEESLLSWATTAGAAGGDDRQRRAAQRDAQVLLMHLQGKPAREIAASAGISHTTVLRTVNRFKESGHGGT